MPKHDDLSLAWLRAFVAVVDFGNEEAAANFLGITQGAVNKRHRALDGCFGNLRLLDGRPLKLTPIGEAFLPVARSVIAQLEAALPNFQNAVPYTRPPPIDPSTVNVSPPVSSESLPQDTEPGSPLPPAAESA